MIKVKICQNNFDKKAADFVSQNAAGCVLALPTGNTPLGMYRELRQRNIDWKRIKIFILDVNYPQNPNEPDSFYSYVKNHLPGVDFNILDSLAKDPEKECLAYELKIKAAGGLDLAVLGIGANGHIAYNEPGTDFNSLTHLTKLKNQPFRYGLTMGIKTITAAKKIILLAKGLAKAKIIKRAVEGKVNPDCPAGILQTHPDVTFILDQPAASRLN